jgi:tripartite ATP-independent transporter DctM subunit
MGIPEMRKRGYPASLATGAIAAGGTLGILIPPSITMIVYGIATETSIGRLFLAGLVPGFMLTVLFMAWSLYTAKRNGYDFASQGKSYTLQDKLVVLPRVVPFCLVIVGVLYVLYGGIATPSEAAGVGAMMCVMLAVVIYKIRDFKKLWAMLSDSMKESVMILMIIAASELFSYTLSSLYITQSIAESIAMMDVNKWVMLAMINVFLLVAGFFLPPVAVILMTAPILLPIILNAGFDPYWFAVIFTINMEIGLITPPVGLNLYVINGICKDVDLTTILKGSFPFVICMCVAIAILAVFPEIALWLPDYVMGPEIT